MTMFRSKTGKAIHCELAVERKPAEFPGDWFKSNPASKPTLNVNKTSNLAKIKRIVRNSMKGDAVPVSRVVTYLYYVLSNQTEISDQNVSSYGIQWSKKGEPFGIFDIVSPLEREEDRADATESAADDITDKCMVLWLLSLYRIEKAKDPNYRDQLIRLITEFLTKEGVTQGFSFNNAIASNPGWFKSPEYKKIVACVDNFYYHYEGSDWADLRVATIGSRYRDCAALLSIGHVVKVLGMSTGTDLLEWVCDDTLGNELESMLMNKEETGQSFSYFPYQVDLGLVSRSAYSARISPATHTFCHVIGALFSNERSLNAKYFLESSVKNVIRNAQWVAYAFSRASKNRKQFQKTQPSESDLRSTSTAPANQFDESMPDFDQEPTDLDSDAWIMYMEAHDWRLTEKMIVFTENARRDVPNPRPKTIGELVGKQVFLGA